MSGKSLVWMGVFVGGFIGGLLPLIWGGGLMADLIWSSIGSAVGIYFAFRLAKSTGAL